MFLFFNQKTAYEVRISDWSSDVCSSDLAKYLRGIDIEHHPIADRGALLGWKTRAGPGQWSVGADSGIEVGRHIVATAVLRHHTPQADRKSTRLNSSH